MDKNELLNLTRTAFLNSYAEITHDLASRGIDILFERADRANSISVQRDLLDARTILMNHTQELSEHLAAAIDKLLVRSFQTAYSSFRPSFSTAFKNQTLSLIDSSTFDGELRLDDITTRMRNASEASLRDLNIRMAVLFDQDDIKERENPFRPYLFAKSISLAVDQLTTEPNLHNALMGVLGNQLIDRVSDVYDTLNAFLAKHGIAADLQLSMRKLPSRAPVETTSAQVVDTSEMSEQSSSGTVFAPHSGPLTSSQEVMSETAHSMRHNQHMVSEQRFDHLLNMLRASARSNGNQPVHLHPHWDSEAPEETVEHGSSAGEFPTQPGGSYPNAGSGYGGPVTDGGYSGGGATGLQGPSGSPEGGYPMVPEGRKARQNWFGGVRSIGGAIRELFTGEAPTSPSMPLSGSLRQSINTLQSAAIQGDEPLLDAHGEVRNLILEMRSELNEAAADLNEQMIIDIVGMLFEFILRDTQVPAEIRAQLGRLQLLVLKTALHDPALFSQKHHPARLLVNRIGSVANGLQQLDPTAERISEEIRRIIEKLLDEDTEDITLFSLMLDELDAFIAQELRKANAKVEKATTAIETAESRTLCYARVSAQTTQAISKYTLDPTLSEFLVNTWAYAIEHAERGEALDALRFRMLVPEIIWSVAPKMEREDRQDLLALIPSLLSTLNEGLQFTSWGAEQCQAFKSWLVEAHRQALRHIAASILVPSLSQMRAEFADFISQTGEDLIRDDYVPPQEVDPLILKEAMSEIEAEIQLIDQMVTTREEVISDDVVMDENSGAHGLDIESLFNRLRAGVDIEINLVGKMQPARLCWMSSKETNMVITMVDQDEPSVISLTLFRRLLNQGRARLKEAEPLFERAVTSLIGSAEALERAAN